MSTDSAPVTPVSSRRVAVARTVYQIALEELDRAHEAYRQDHTPSASRALRAAWHAHKAATSRLNELTRAARSAR